MIDLDPTYQRLAGPWSHDQLATRYDEANSRGARTAHDIASPRAPPISLLAGAIPATTNLNVAIHVLHVLPAGARDPLAQQLLETSAQTAADALHRCHLALEIDGDTHAYTPADWLPLVYDTAAQLLQSAQLDHEPPAIVHHAHQAVHWLADAIAELDQDSPETTAALTDTLAHLLVIFVFARTAQS
ncbi:MAG: hypothetical protein ACLP22_07785 [Solirubrobacteraceae bacterium]